MYTWTQEPGAATSGHAYEIIDTVEFSSPVPVNGTREEAIADYAAQASDQTTPRNAVLREFQDGSVIATQGGDTLFQMPGGHIPDAG